MPIDIRTLLLAADLLKVFGMRASELWALQAPRTPIVVGEANGR